MYQGIDLGRGLYNLLIYGGGAILFLFIIIIVFFSVKLLAGLIRDSVRQNVDNRRAAKDPVFAAELAELRAEEDALEERLLNEMLEEDENDDDDDDDGNWYDDIDTSGDPAGTGIW